MKPQFIILVIRDCEVFLLFNYRARLISRYLISVGQNRRFYQL